MNLQPQHIDAIREIVNIGIGRAAGMLNEMLKSHVELQVPSIKIFSHKDLEKELGVLCQEKLSCIRMQFKGPFSGVALLIFPPDSASELVDLLIDEIPEQHDLDSIRIGTLTEVGNIVLNGVMGSIGNILDKKISYSVPSYLEDTISKSISSNTPCPDSVIMLVRAYLNIKKHMIKGEIIILFEVGYFDALIEEIESSFHQISDQNKSSFCSTVEDELKLKR